MPLPKPKAREEKDKFILRCMKDDISRNEFPDRMKRRAICEMQWVSKKVKDILNPKKNA